MNREGYRGRTPPNVINRGPNAMISSFEAVIADLRRWQCSLQMGTITAVNVDDTVDINIEGSEMTDIVTVGPVSLGAVVPVLIDRKGNVVVLGETGTDGGDGGPVSLALNDLTDVDSLTATPGQTIVWNGSLWLPGDVGSASGGAGAPTITIAAYNAHTISKNKADVVCDGTNDEEAFVYAMGLLDNTIPGTGVWTRGRINLTEGQYNIATKIVDPIGSREIVLTGVGSEVLGEWQTFLNVSTSISGAWNNWGSVSLHDLRFKGNSVWSNNWVIDNCWLELNRYGTHADRITNCWIDMNWGSGRGRFCPSAKFSNGELLCPSQIIGSILRLSLCSSSWRRCRKWNSYHQQSLPRQ